MPVIGFVMQMGFDSLHKGLDLVFSCTSIGVWDLEIVWLSYSASRKPKKDRK